LFATPTRAKRRNCVFAPPPKIGRKNAAEFCFSGGFSASRIFFRRIFGGTKFFGGAAKFGG